MASKKLALASATLLIVGIATYLLTAHQKTWADNRTKLVVQLKHQISDAPAAAMQPFADCLADGLVALADTLKCSFPEAQELQSIFDCAKSKGEVNKIIALNAACVDSVTTQLGAPQ